MNADNQGLIHGYLDGLLADGQLAELNAWIKASPENAKTFARAVALHNRLRDVIVAEQGIDATAGEPGHKIQPAAQLRPGRGRRLGVYGSLAGMAALVLITILWNFQSPLNAATELNRLIKTLDLRDRTYIVHNLDSDAEQSEERRPPIDGATLYVRNPNQYVLIRTFSDGRRFINGSDGDQNWSIPPDGDIHVSKDPQRFRSPLPGHEQGIPFVDLQSDLLQLREAYDVSILKDSSNRWTGLLCEKRSAEYRGAKRVELWYDSKTGAIQRMVFDKLPRARGGPKSVSVELVGQQDLAADFFKHESHHAPNRRAIEEE